jgi:hypothetical protein
VPTIDGLFAGEPSGSNKLSMTINQDAVAEVKVLRNNTALNTATTAARSSTSFPRAEAKTLPIGYYFLRNESLNATPFSTTKPV